jgi:hypothetical protein
VNRPLAPACIFHRVGLWMGGTGNLPVPVGDPPTGTESDRLMDKRDHLTKRQPQSSVGPVARRHGRVARATRSYEISGLELRRVVIH